METSGRRNISGATYVPLFLRARFTPVCECAADGAPEYFISRKKETKKRLPEVKERPRGQEAGPGPEDSSELNWDFALARAPFFFGSILLLCPLAYGHLSLFPFLAR